MNEKAAIQIIVCTGPVFQSIISLTRSRNQSIGPTAATKRLKFVDMMGNESESPEDNNDG